MKEKNMKQLLLFQDDPEVILKTEIEYLKEKIDTLRKGQHARISMLQKDLKDVKSELEFLKSHICKNDLFL